MPRIRAASIEEHKTVTRRALLDSARDLIGRAGTIAIPLGDVALSAGVGRTTFYDYFTDRDDVIAALVEEELPGVLEAIIDDVDASGSIPYRLGELVSAMVRFVAADPVLGVILHQESGRLAEGPRRRIEDSHKQLSSEMTALYRQGVDDGIFRPMPAALAGVLIQDTIMSAAKLCIDGRVEDLDAVVAGVRSFLITGLGHRE